MAFKIPQNPFSARALPRTPLGGGAHVVPPDRLVGWRGDTPQHTPPHSAPTHFRRSPCVPPQNSSQIYAYASTVSTFSEGLFVRCTREKLNAVLALIAPTGLSTSYLFTLNQR